MAAYSQRAARPSFNEPFQGGLMKRLATLSLFAACALYCPSFSQDAPASAPASSPAAASPSFSVDSMVIAASVESRAPVGVNSEFSADVGKVSCSARVSSSRPPISLTFVWYKDGQVVLEWPYSLITETGRLWATKTVSTGKWKVEIVDSGKNIIKTIDFDVK